MYSVDANDRIRILDDIPPCCVGAPVPAVVAREHFTVLAYIIATPPPEGWHGQYATMISPDSGGQEIAVISFSICAEHRFGWFPSEETYPNHPLADRGVVPYGAFEVIDSSWVRQLAKLESVDLDGREQSLRRKRHFILTFHDSTFECVADEYSAETHHGSIISALNLGVERLKRQ